MGDEKYAKALDKLIDARDEIARLCAKLAEAREVVQIIYPYAVDGARHVRNSPSSSEEHIRETGEDIRRARAFIDRGT